MGRRLAFDAAKGRLWVVCRACERWNLTPLEERWEAVEECERAFRATPLRVSTEHIGLARLKEGTELVRIGEPQRPEMAAWRYGDQFGRRQRRQMLLGIAPGIALPFVGHMGVAAGLFSAGLSAPVVYSAWLGYVAFKSRESLRLPIGAAETAAVRRSDMRHTQLLADGDGIVLRLPVLQPPRGGRVVRTEPAWRARDFTGEGAVRVAGGLLPHINRSGGSKADVSRAVEFLEESPDPMRLFRRAVDAIEARDAGRRMATRTSNALCSLPTAGRLALEMAAHEESERRALDGELHVLEAAWREAEMIAGIADDMLLPASVPIDLARLKRQRDGA